MRQGWYWDRGNHVDSSCITKTYHFQLWLIGAGNISEHMGRHVMCLRNTPTGGMSSPHLSVRGR